MAGLKASIKETLRPLYHQCVRKPLLSTATSVLQRLPVSSQAAGPPKGVCPDTQAWVTAYNARTKSDTARFTPVHGAERLTLTPTGSGDGDALFFERYGSGLDSPRIEWDARQRPSTLLPAAFVAEVPQGRVWGEDGAIITPDDRMLGDVSPDYIANRYLRGKHPLLAQLRLPPVHYVGGTVAVLGTLGQRYYAHWMLDALPRIGLLQAAGYRLEDIDKFYLAEPLSSYQQESLEAAGIAPDRIIDYKTRPHIRADRLLAPSHWHNVFACSQFACDYLRRLFLPEAHANQQMPDRPRRLYISRAGASHRRILNEADVIEALTAFGFETVRAEELSLNAKAPLFASAEVIVAPLGSAMSNYVFCSPGAMLLEFLNPRAVQICSWAVCSRRQMTYRYLWAQGADPNAGELAEDLRIDVDALVTALRDAGVREV